MTDNLGPNLEEEIKTEILKCKQEHGEGWGMCFFNNFDGYLPGGFMRYISQPIRSQHRPHEKGSEIKRKQTLDEFFATIDKAIEKVNIAPEQIFVARTSYHDSTYGVGVLDNEIFELIIPIYIELRKMGYNHYPDLTS
ncbi:MAG: hypothetical protein NTX24_04355 [Candidatus Pacearchaeota archaeon]|nr:hypothetical protein [Candidatus Pacearchaeota archaeon]